MSKISKTILEENPNQVKYISQYADIINQIVSFFDGKDQYISNQILTQIDQCIESQNFERASKLRDIYHNISKFTSKQSIVLDQNISGQIRKYRIIGDKVIYIVIHIIQSKVVDILRFSDSVDELSQIISSIYLEYGDMQDIYTSDTEYIGVSAGIHWYKSTIKELNTHLDNAIQSYILSSSRETDSVMSDLLKILQQKYNLNRYPYKIECLDISHISGDRASAGLSSMQAGLAYPKGYRQYKISKDIGGDDYASLVEVITRRFDLEQIDRYIDHIDKYRDEHGWPDLFVIDGGVGQLNILYSLITIYPGFEQVMKQVDFVSLGKGSARRSGSKIYGEIEHIYQLRDTGDIGGSSIAQYDIIYDDADRLLVKCRDEAHRFANRYRKKQMSQDFQDKK